jgi:hydrogenase maturation protease
MGERRILVLGIGNLVMGDEGVGVHAARCLAAAEPLPPTVTVVDGGTGGFHLLSYFEEYDVLIMIDAVVDGRPPGTVGVLRPRYASDFPRALTAHDIGLRDLVESAALVGSLPPIHLVTVSIGELSGLSLELSPAVAAALPEVSALVHDLIAVEWAAAAKAADGHA